MLARSCGTGASQETMAARVDAQEPPHSGAAADDASAASGVDALAESLSLSFRVTQDVNSTDAPHPRFHMFKAKVPSGQAERRRQFLEKTKQRRQDFSALARRLVSGMACSLSLRVHGDDL